MTASRYRGSIAVWAALLAYASLYPFYPLRLPSPESVGALFLAPRYVIRADIAFNVVAYVPLGLLAALYFRARGDRHPLLLALAFGAAFSFVMEAAQLFVPNRVATVVDVAANALGTLIGIVAFAEPLNSLVTSRLAQLREDLILPGAWGDAALVLLMLWFLAQLNPALPFFGAGDIVSQGAGELRVMQWIAVGMGICGFGLFVSAIMKPEHGGLRMTVVLLSVALWLKFAFASLMLQPNFSADWVSTGRVLGLMGGMLAFIPLRRVGRTGRTYLALVLILAGALFAKIFGAYSPLEELLRLFRWPHGQLASFATLTRFLHELWPFAAVTFLASLFIRSRHVAMR
jgi:VanZ family protein